MIKEELPNPSDELPIFYGLPFQPGDVVERFSHFVVAVTDLDRSEAWYRDIVGLDGLGRGLMAEERPHSVLRMNTGQLLVLVQDDEIVKGRQKSQGIHHGFVLTQSQFNRCVQRLKEHAVPVVAQREEYIARGQYSIDVYDPDGHHYQIETEDLVQAHEVLLPAAGIVDCGPSDNFKVGDVKLFNPGNFYLVRLREGFLALSRWCTHMNGLVAYQRQHWQFWCPMHSATYDRRGMPSCSTVRHPELAPLRLNPISFNEAGHLLVNTDEVIQRTYYDASQAAPPPRPSRAQSPVGAPS